MSLCRTIGYLSRAHGETGYGYGPIAFGEEELTELMIMPDLEGVAYFIDRMVVPDPCHSAAGKRSTRWLFDEGEPVQAYAERQGLFVIPPPTTRINC